jgi:hypothetical protein
MHWRISIDVEFIEDRNTIRTEARKILEELLKAGRKNRRAARRRSKAKSGSSPKAPRSGTSSTEVSSFATTTPDLWSQLLGLPCTDNLAVCVVVPTTGSVIGCELVEVKASSLVQRITHSESLCQR